MNAFCGTGSNSGMGKDLDIQVNIAAAWRLMTGKPDGLRMLDLSADGFWNSFFAILVSLPALFVGWLALAQELNGIVPFGRVSTILRLATIDMAAWIVPLIALGLFARSAGLANRFVPYVVATNWASVIVIWIMLAPALLRMAMPNTVDLAALLSLALFGLTMALMWRLTNTVIGRGPAIGSAVFAAMFVVSLTTLVALQSLLGISGPP